MMCSSQHWASISTASFIYRLATFIKQRQRTSLAQGKGTEELNVSPYHSESLFSNHCNVVYGTASQEQNPAISTCSLLKQGSQIKCL